MDTIWIVVASAARARLFTCRGRVGALEEVADPIHPQSRLQAGEVDSDAPGRSFDRRGEGRHAMAAHDSPQHVEARRFAADLAETLAQARTAQRFARFYLVAPARMLGDIRKALDEPTRARLSGTVEKDLVTHTVEDIRAHLPDYL